MSRLIVLILFFSLVKTSIANASASNEIESLITQAEGGNVLAQFKVASAYDSGVGLPRNANEALKWYLLAARNGNAESQNSLGSICQAEKNYKEALVWFIEASEQGHLVAINNLAYLYDLGLGVEQDRTKALSLYEKAANLGWADAMWNIANSYGSGVLGEKDLYSACIWSMRAKRYAEPYNTKLKNYLENIPSYLKSELGTKRFENCIKEAENWTPE